jgi:hypothetical protein
MNFQKKSNLFCFKKSNFPKKKKHAHIFKFFSKLLVIFHNSKFLHYSSFIKLGWNMTFVGEQAHHTKFPFKFFLRFLSFPFPNLRFFWGFFLNILEKLIDVHFSFVGFLI